MQCCWNQTGYLEDASETLTQTEKNKKCPKCRRRYIYIYICVHIHIIYINIYSTHIWSFFTIYLFVCRSIRSFTHLAKSTSYESWDAPRCPKALDPASHRQPVPRNWPFRVRCCYLWWRWSTPGNKHGKHGPVWSGSTWKMSWSYAFLAIKTVDGKSKSPVGRWLVPLMSPQLVHDFTSVS